MKGFVDQFVARHGELPFADGFEAGLRHRAPDIDKVRAVKASDSLILGGDRKSKEFYDEKSTSLTP